MVIRTNERRGAEGLWCVGYLELPSSTVEAAAVRSEAPDLGFRGGFLHEKRAPCGVFIEGVHGMERGSNMHHICEDIEDF
jgi:hypothetical protein